MEEAFHELIERVRQGDGAAAAELVRRYEPAIRRAVRFRLTDPRLRRTCDSMDVCQSVLASFFVRAASGQYDLETPEQLRNLLIAMARNKLGMQFRREHSQKRDNRLVVNAAPEEQDVAAAGSSPSRQVEARELLHEVHKRLNDEERQLVELRQQGLKWSEIAEQVQGSAEALRKKVERALDRIAEAVVAHTLPPHSCASSMRNRAPAPSCA